MERPKRSLLILAGWLFLASRVLSATPWFGVQAVDEATGRGIPLIEFRTVNDLRLVTDSAGWAAFLEPGLMERDVWFSVNGPGYEMAKDGFGFAGVRLTPKAGERVPVKLKRTNIAERLGRLTGQGIYRDSELLGLPFPLPNLNAVGVMGQDSVQATPYRGQLFWLWGDTNVPHYPLGNYRTTCAVTPLEVDPEKGIAFAYFPDSTKPHQPRQMMPMESQGAVWLFGLLTVRDGDEEVLLAHYGRHIGLKPPDEHGIARFNDARGVFESVRTLSKEETWRFPQGSVTRHGEFFYFAHPFLHTRVKATLADVLSPESYEALRWSAEEKRWDWQRDLPPTLQGEDSPTLPRYDLEDAESGTPVRIHRGSVRWNAWRKRWILIGVESGRAGSPSALGEVWYAESAAPDGPWKKAVKVASHPRYSFYNPVHHDFLDAEDGRVIYFEGTYSLEFSGNPIAPARYDYNQLLYRLDLGDERLKAAW